MRLHITIKEIIKNPFNHDKNVLIIKKIKSHKNGKLRSNHKSYINISSQLIIEKIT